MPQQVVLANSMRQAIVTIPKKPSGTGGAQWPAIIPEILQTQSNNPGGSVPLTVTLPVGGALLITFSRTNVNPAAEVYVKISRNANGVQVEDKKTDANNLSFSTQQSGPAGNEQVILTFNGHE
ncbi:MAG: hypothetical protein WCC90_00750 [Methylocella sp.]